MKTKIILLLAAAALCAGSLITWQANAAPRPLHRAEAGQPHPILARIADRLELTADQKSQIRAVLKAEKDTLASLITQLHDARKSLRETILSKNATEDSIRTASAKVAAVEADMAVERVKLRKQISPILTEEQRAKAAEMAARLDDFVTDAIGRIGERLAE
jgi:protein CpxP